MTRPIVTIPPDLIRFSAVSWDIDWRGQSVPGQDGATQIVYNRFPRWIGAAEMVLPAPQLARWRGVRAAAQGRRAVFRVPLVDPISYDREARVPADLRERGLPFSNGERLSTGYGLAYEETIPAAAVAAKGAELVRVTVGAYPAPVVGQIMSCADLPFVVTSVRALPGGDHELGVQMPLRAVIAEGDRIALRGWGLFELAGDTTAGVEYGLSRLGRPKLDLVEWLR